MTSPLERAARAVEEEIGGYAIEDGYMAEGGVRNASHCQDIARAVIEAIREPSEGMAEAGGENIVHDDGQTDGDASTAKAVWRDMIDTILEEG